MLIIMSRTTVNKSMCDKPEIGTWDHKHRRTAETQIKCHIKVILHNSDAQNSKQYIHNNETNKLNIQYVKIGLYKH